VLALVEVLLIAIGFVGAVSSGLVALRLFAMLAGLFGIFGSALAGVTFVLDRPSVRRWLPSASSLVTALAFSSVAVVLLWAIDRVLFLEAPEFPREVERMRSAGRLAAVALLFVAFGTLRPRISDLFDGLSEALRDWLSVAVVLATALGGLLTAHFAFAPVHQVGAAGVATLGALGLVGIAMRVRGWPVRALEMKAIVVGSVAIGVLGAALPGAAGDSAKFVVWGHSSGAGLAELLRDALDGDHDAALPSWLFGGGDCAPGNSAIGPLELEVPGDGIDQDCRGGDAKLHAALAPATMPEGCGAVPPQPDVIVIAVDALRADAVVPEIMPALSELGSHALFFERAYSPTAMTFTSVTAILSGGPFADVGPKNPLVDENIAPKQTLPERFHQAGYRTAAFTDFFDHAVFRRGFDRVNPYWRDVPIRGVKGSLTSAAMSRGMLDFLQTGSGPAFLWAHASDTHAHYSLDHDEHGNQLSDEQAYYRGAHYVDEQLGQLFAQLQQQRRMQRTIVAVLADHGEELLAHGREGHGPNLFEESIHVPLVLWVPGCLARHFKQPVSLAHLAPTLGTLSGVDFAGIGLTAQGELPTVVEGVTGLNTTYKRAVIDGRYKLLLDVNNGGRMLFDLESDPQELTDILGDAPDVTEHLERAYQRWLDAPGRR
jgi:Sulfatase